MSKLNDAHISPQLIFVLKDILKVYKELLNMSRKKTDILVKGDVKQLDEITQVEQDLISTLGKLEEERYSIISRLAKIYKKDIEDIKHDFIVDLLSEDDAKNFCEIKDELKHILKQVDEINKTNGRLIQQNLDFINLSIELLTDTGEAGTSYSADGSTAKNEAFHIIDQKA